MHEDPKKVGKLLDVETWEALRAAGFSEEEIAASQPLGPIVFAYTRADAIDDGVLIDLRREGFDDVLKLSGVGESRGRTISVAMTETSFRATVGSIVRQRTKLEQTEVRSNLIGVLHDMRAAVKATTGGDRVHWTSRDVRGGEAKLWALCGPGDDAEPVITIMLEGED